MSRCFPRPVEPLDMSDLIDNDMCMSCVSGNEGRVVFTGGVLLAKDHYTPLCDVTLTR